jgi:hypothetical protein
MRISGEEFKARPAARVGELLEAVLGLIVTQHSGEGKANQYFLRGFNLDHGTDLAITVDGMPVNMPTHGHGQGYADINFLIPELVQSVNVRKGLTSPIRATLPPLALLGSTMSAGCRRTSRRSPLAASATSVDLQPVRPRSARARCSRPSRPTNITGRGMSLTMSAS